MGALPLVGGDVSGYVVGFAWAVLGLGLIVMAVIQSVKDLFPIRRWFNASFTQAWLRRKSAMHGAGIVPDPDTAFDDLVALATTGNAAALFDLPVDQFAAQVAAAASQALDYPDRHADLLRCIAASADPDDIAMILNTPDLPAQATDERARTAFVDARTRVLHHTQRSVDALQISVGYRWKWLLQMSAFALALAIASIAALSTTAGSVTPGQRLLTALPLGLVGGFVAPVTRDLIVRLTQRTGR